MNKDIFYNNNLEKRYKEILLKLSKKAILKKEVPISAIILNKNNKIISKAFNKSYKTKNLIMHAEIIVIKKAYKKLKTKNLKDCKIIINVEPCMMCLGAILLSKINKIIYFLDEAKYGYINSNHIIDLSKINILKINDDKEFKKMMKLFFDNLRE